MTRNNMIVLILILAFILRLINLNQSLWLDEAVQAITAQNSIAYIFQEITGDFHPPLYYFLMHCWVLIFGSSEITLRMPSVLFGVGTVYFLYKLTMHVHSRFVAILVSLFLATAPFHIYYSQEARMYSMACFFTALSMYFFVIINELFINGLKNCQEKGIPRLVLLARNDNVLFVCYFIATTLAIFTDYYAFLVLLAQGIYLLARRKYKYLILNTCFLILCYLPWIPMFVTQIKTGMLATKMLPDWGKLVNVSFVKAVPLTLIKFTIGRITIFNKKVYAFVSTFIIFFYGFLISKGYFKGKKLLITNYQLLITLWFFVPLVVSWLASLFVPNFQPFRLLLILPAFYLLLVMGVGESEGDRRIRGIVIAIILTINLVSLSAYYFNPYFHREDWRGLVKYLQQQEDSVVILPSSASNWPIRYYDPEGKIILREGVGGVGKIKEVEDIEGDKAYYIRYLIPLFDPNELILAKLREQGYTKTVEISFNQIPVWKYELVTGD